MLVLVLSPAVLSLSKTLDTVSLARFSASSNDISSSSCAIADGGDTTVVDKAHTRVNISSTTGIAALTYMLSMGPTAGEITFPKIFQAAYGQQQQLLLQPTPLFSERDLEFNGTDAKTLALVMIFGSDFIGGTFHEDGTIVLEFNNPQIGNFTVQGGDYSPVISPERGYRFENNSIYIPDGRELVIVPD